MSTTELTFTSGGYRLAGGLTVPEGTGPFPAVLLVPGSGPVDRDSNHKRMPLDVTGALARALAPAGFVTFAFDKRGTGASEGDWMSASLDEATADARAALELLRSRPEVDASRVIVVGHSEGAIHATRLAADGGLAGAVLLSASAAPGEELLAWQAANVAASLPRLVKRLLALLRQDLEAKTAKNRGAIKATTPPVARVGGQKVNAAWHRQFMALDPRTELAQVEVPVLAVTGAKDLQVKSSDLRVIARTVRGAVDAREISDLTHILRRQLGEASLGAYKKELRTPVDPRVVSAVVDWALELASARV